METPRIKSATPLWGNNDFRLLFSAQIISLLGSGVTTVGLALFAYQLTGGASATAVIGNALMLRILAFLLFSQPAGVIADRVSRKPLYLLTLYLSTGCRLFLEGEDRMEELTRGELAKQGGVNIETIRYYERRGLLPKPARTMSGYRIFSLDDVRRVRFIKRAQELGFSLKEIADLFALQNAPHTTRADVRKRAEAKIADIDEKLRDLTAMKESLERLTAACSGRGSLRGCPILESFDSLLS
ncbi:MAG: MerR family DNA-binding protein [Blastocatellia bacterium]